MLRLHLDCCLSMPGDVRNKIEQLKVSCSSRGGRKQYWIDSAKRLGLVDTPHGIHFGRDPLGPLPPLAGPSVNSKEGRQKKKAPAKAHAILAANAASLPSMSPSEPNVAPPSPPKQQEMEPVIEPEELLPPPPPVDNRPLVFPEDQDLISDYLYLTLEQMSPCILMEADRVGCYKTRQVRLFMGLASLTSGCWFCKVTMIFTSFCILIFTGGLPWFGLPPLRWTGWMWALLSRIGSILVADNDESNDHEPCAELPTLSN